MSQPNDIPNPFDPLGFWRTTQNASLEAWSKTMIELVNTEAYAEATGRLLDTYLAASVPMRRAIEQAMTQVLGQVNMPSRAEVLSIAERMTNIEMRLDDLDARFDDLQRTLTQIAANTVQVKEASVAAASRSRAKTATTSAPANDAAIGGRPRRSRSSSASGATAGTASRRTTATRTGAKE
jgi:seryl-tRNA synthetase